MKYLKTTALLLFILAFNSCEKDDICAETTPTTPKLIIEFYDSANPENTKNVTNLKVTGFNDANEGVDLPSVNITTTNTINLPLRTDKDQTKFTFHKEYDSGNLSSGNPDIVTISYQREDVFVSRACGFKTIFKELILTVETDGDNWILDYEIINSTVENEITAHVKIFH